MRTIPEDLDARRVLLDRLASAPAALPAAAVPAVVACLATPVKAVQRQAADLLIRTPPEIRPAVVDALRAAVDSSDPRWRWGAAWALGRLGVVDQASRPRLVEALGAPDGDVRWAAAEILIADARVAPDAALPSLLAAAVDPEPARRKMALYVLRDAAVTEPAVRPLAVTGLGDSAVGVRFAALALLIRLVPLPDDACARVLACARDDPDPGLRRAALAALGTVGRGVSEAARVLAAAATAADPGTRRAAQDALRRLDSGDGTRRTPPARSGPGSG